MSNPAEAKANREEEIALLAMEQVLGVDIALEDAGRGNKRPDGSWIYPDRDKRRGIVEITSPPATDFLRDLARAKRAGYLPQVESGSFPARINELTDVCAELLSTVWAKENFDKLLDQPAHERHLFLFARRHEEATYFYRLSEPLLSGIRESLDDLALPEGISDVWFRGRVTAGVADTQRVRQVRVARFHVASGWHRYTVRIDEGQLPPPNPDLADDDDVPDGGRAPKDRAS